MSNDAITELFTTILIILGSILAVLVIVFIILKVKSKKPEKREDLKITTEKKQAKISEPITYNKQSIFNFMDFDRIEDNMIIRKKGNKYLMVIECQGVNYDLMSGLEKNSVEQGFLQFLNTLRYPVQLYIQTRTVNLEKGIINYKERVNVIKDRLLKKKMEYARKEGLDYSEKELNNARLELTREQNLYEYGIDIIQNTERMSLNKNILRKNYFVIIDYTPEDINSSNYSKDEISSMAFSELYTKAQSVIGALSVCGVNGKILDSNELAELLYIAYNRDDSEIYDLEKALNAKYDELYRTAPDVLDKRMKELEIYAEQEANKLANETVIKTIEENEKARRVKQEEDEIDQIIREMAQSIIDENQELVGKKVAEQAKEKIRKKKVAKTTKDKEGKVENEEK